MRHHHDITGLMKRLRALWLHRRAHAFLHIGCLSLLVAMLLLAVVFLLDWRLRLEVPMRLAVLALAVLAIVSTACLLWRKKRRPYDPVACALEVEREHPQLGGLLVSYVQFSGADAEDAGASPALISAMRQQAEEKTRGLPFHKHIRYGVLWRLYLSVTLASMAFGGAAMLHPGFAKAFASRILNPFSETSYPTRTVLHDTSGKLMARQGESVRFRAVLGGEVPAEITIRFFKDERVEDVRITANDAPDASGMRVFEMEMENIQQDFQYRILAGDAISKTYDVRLIRRPEESIDAQVIYPAYLASEPETPPILSFDAPAGSSVKWKISLDRPVSNGRMIFGDGSSTDLRVAESNRYGVLTLTPGDSFTYGFEWTDDESGFVFEPALWHQVRVLPDHPPTVVLEPGPDEEKATVWKAVDLAFRAADDHGLASARLIYTLSRLGSEGTHSVERIIELTAFPPNTRETTEKFEWRLKDSIPDLFPGDVVTYAVEVLDHQPEFGGAGLGRSESRTITIVTQEEYAELAMQRRRLLLSRIQNLLDAEIDADNMIESLLHQLAE